MIDTQNCECPHCHADLRSTVIPEKSRWMFGSSDVCAGCGGEPHFSRLIGIYSTEKDRTIAWRCPACNKQWKR